MQVYLLEACLLPLFYIAYITIVIIMSYIRVSYCIVTITIVLSVFSIVTVVVDIKDIICSSVWNDTSRVGSN